MLFKTIIFFDMQQMLTSNIDVITYIHAILQLTRVRSSNSNIRTKISTFTSLISSIYTLYISTLNCPLTGRVCGRVPLLTERLPFLLMFIYIFFYCNLMNLLPRQIHHQSSISSTFGNSVFYLFIFFLKEQMIHDNFGVYMDN